MMDVLSTKASEYYDHYNKWTDKIDGALNKVTGNFSYRSAIKASFIWTTVTGLIQATALNPFLFNHHVFLKIGIGIGGSLACGAPFAGVIHRNIKDHVEMCEQRFESAEKVYVLAFTIFFILDMLFIIFHMEALLSPSAYLWGIGAAGSLSLLISSVQHHSSLDVKGMKKKIYEETIEIKHKLEKLEDIRDNILEFINNNRRLAPLFMEKQKRYMEFFHLVPSTIQKYEDCKTIFEQRTNLFSRCDYLSFELIQFHSFLQSEPELFRIFKEELLKLDSSATILTDYKQITLLSTASKKDE